MAKTFDRVRKQFYWHGMKKDVHEWVSSCEVCCQKSLHTRNTYTALQRENQVIRSGKSPWTLWDLYLSKVEKKYILSIGDQFTNWYEAIPMSNQEASTVTKVFVNIWFSRFGFPSNLHSDKGVNFLSNLFKNMCKELGINRISTTAYHPQ